VGLVKTIQARAAHAYNLIVTDLSGRPSLLEAWSKIETAIRQEIATAWCAIVGREIRAAIKEERERCAQIVRKLPRWEDGEEARMDAVFLIAHPDRDPAEEPGT
jgi:hypothetical protein